MTSDRAWLVRLVVGMALPGPIGVFLLIVGGHDIALATRTQERLAGGVLAAAGVALTLSLVLLVRGQRGWMARCLLGVGSFGGLTLLAIQAGFATNYWSWAWVSIALIPFASALLLPRRTRPSLAPTRAKPYLRDPSSGAGTKRTAEGKSIATALLAAGATVLASLVGLLGGAFRPVADPSVLQVLVTASVVGHRTQDGQQFALVDTVVTMKNIGRDRLVVFGSTYTIQGYRSDVRPSANQDSWPFPDELSQYGWSGRFEAPLTPEAVEFSYDVVPPGYFLEPDQEESFDELTPVPTQQYNTATSVVAIATGYEDRLRLDRQRQSARDQHISRDNSVGSSWDIAPTGWVATLTRGHQDLQISYGLDVAPTGGVVSGMNMTYQVTHESQRTRTLGQGPAADYTERVRTFYGAAFTQADHSVRLDGN